MKRGKPISFKDKLRAQVNNLVNIVGDDLPDPGRRLLFKTQIAYLLSLIDCLEEEEDGEDD